MGFETVERQWTRDKLNDVAQAVAGYPSAKDYVLDEFSILQLMKMSEVADCDVVITFKPRKDVVPDTLPEEWLN